MAITFLEFVDLPDPPRAKIDLPLLRIGDLLNLHFHLERMHLGRRELLEINGEYRITGVSMNRSYKGYHQIVRLSATGKAPSWRAIKLPPAKILPPARFPPTKVE